MPFATGMSSNWLFTGRGGLLAQALNASMMTATMTVRVKFMRRS
jgi:hypothetical protein